MPQSAPAMFLQAAMNIATGQQFTISQDDGPTIAVTNADGVTIRFIRRFNGGRTMFFSDGCPRQFRNIIPDPFRG